MSFLTISKVPPVGKSPTGGKDVPTRGTPNIVNIFIISTIRLFPLIVYKKDYWAVIPLP